MKTIPPTTLSPPAMAMLKGALHSHAFFILGAGASYGLVPFTGELKDTIVREHLANGSFEAHKVQLPQEAQRIVGDLSNYFEPNELNGNAQIANELLQRLHPSAVMAITARELAARRQHIPPDSYAVFGLASRKLTILNYNTDGLANRYCANHILIHPHGTLPASTVRGKLWSEIVEDCLKWGVPCPVIPDVVFPGREPKEVSLRKEFKFAEQRYLNSEVVVIVGYSFGNYDGVLDDWVSYEKLIWFFRKRPLPILLIGPDCHELQLRLELDLHRKVHRLTANWQHLSACLIEESRLRRLYPEIKEGFRISAEWLYERQMDRYGAKGSSYHDVLDRRRIYVPLAPDWS